MTIHSSLIGNNFSAFEQLLRILKKCNIFQRENNNKKCFFPSYMKSLRFNPVSVTDMGKVYIVVYFQKVSLDDWDFSKK